MYHRFLTLVISLAGMATLTAQPILDDADDPDPATLKRLVKSLGSVDFREREMATAALRRVGDPRKLAEMPDSVRCLTFSRDGKRLLAGVFDAKIHVLDADSGKTLTTWGGHHDTIMCLALSRDGRTLLSGGGQRDQSVCVRD